MQSEVVGFDLVCIGEIVYQNLNFQNRELARTKVWNDLTHMYPMCHTHRAKLEFTYLIELFVYYFTGQHVSDVPLPSPPKGLPRPCVENTRLAVSKLFIPEGGITQNMELRHSYTINPIPEASGERSSSSIVSQNDQPKPEASSEGGSSSGVSQNNGDEYISK
jgi:hypothetical protein